MHGLADWSSGFFLLGAGLGSHVILRLSSLAVNNRTLWRHYIHSTSQLTRFRKSIILRRLSPTNHYFITSAFVPENSSGKAPPGARPQMYSALDALRSKAIDSSTRDLSHHPTQPLVGGIPQHKRRALPRGGPDGRAGVQQLAQAQGQRLDYSAWARSQHPTEGRWYDRVEKLLVAML